MGIIKRFFSEELTRGSIILILSIGLFNLFNVVFHFGMGRLLGPEDYSIIAAIISMAYIFTIPTEAIQTILSKYTTKFFNNKEKINNLLVKSIKKFLIISIVCFVLFSLLSPLIGKILKIDYKLIIFSGLMIFGIFFLPIGRGILQGKKKFTGLGFSFFIEGFVKVSFGVLLVILGFGVYGAVGGILASMVIGIIIIFCLMKDIIKVKSKRTKVRGIYSYSYPTLISFAGIILFLSLDVLIAKSLFSEKIAGQYALISLFGKVIFFSSNPICKAMFPIISKLKNKKKMKRILKKSGFFVLIIAIIAMVFYWFFGTLLINIIGKDFLGLEKYILLPAIAMTFLALTNVLIHYNLAIDKLKRNLFIGLFVLLQIVLLMAFHQTILRFMIAFIVSNAITFIFFLFAYFKR